MLERVHGPTHRKEKTIGGKKIQKKEEKTTVRGVRIGRCPNSFGCGVVFRKTFGRLR